MQHFESYLQRATEAMRARKRTRSNVVSALNVLGLIGAIVLYLAELRSLIVCAGIFVVWATIVDAVANNVFGKRESKRRSSDPLAAASEERLEEFEDYRAKSTLADRFHPVVAAKLEACARAFAEIARGVDEPSWKARHSGSDWDRLAESAMTAADEAMRGAVLACSGGFRPKGMARKAFDKKVQGDPDAARIVRELERVEGELKSLSEALGVDAKGRQSSMEDVLASIAEIRQAEAELDGHVTVNR